MGHSESFANINKYFIGIFFNEIFLNNSPSLFYASEPIFEIIFPVHLIHLFTAISNGASASSGDGNGMSLLNI